MCLSIWVKQNKRNALVVFGSNAVCMDNIIIDTDPFYILLQHVVTWKSVIGIMFKRLNILNWF